LPVSTLEQFKRRCVEFLVLLSGAVAASLRHKAISDKSGFSWLESYKCGLDASNSGVGPLEDRRVPGPQSSELVCYVSDL
jgi:hypothetical protein